MDIESRLDELAGGSPTPGGGTGIALAAAVGASLVAMTARVTLRSPRHETQDRLLEAIAEGADETRARLLRLAEDDAEAFRRVLDAQDAAARQAALKEATEIPLRIMEQTLEVIGLGKTAVESALKIAASDGAAGVEIGRAALKGAAHTVRANLAHIDDEAFQSLSRTRMDEMLYMGTRVATNVESLVTDLWA